MDGQPPTETTKNQEIYNKALMQLNLQQEKVKEKVSYVKSYVVSILLPPLGVFFFIKYLFFSEREENHMRAALLNLVLTIISLVVNIWLIQLFLSQSLGGNSQNLDTIKALITPENQRDLQQLLQ